jgi:type V secretory pathway adhesin AidA
MAFTVAPSGLVLSHVAPTGTTHSSAFHVVKSCFVDNTKMTDNVTAKVEVYSSAANYDAGKVLIDTVDFTFTLARSDARGAKHDVVLQAYNTLLGLDSPDGTSTDYTHSNAERNARAENSSRPTRR